MSGPVPGWVGAWSPPASWSPPPLVISRDEREALLSEQVRMAVARGGHMQHADTYSATIIYGKPVKHVLHALLTLFLLGLWLFVWIPLAIAGGEKRELIHINGLGRVTTQKV